MRGSDQRGNNEDRRRRRQWLLDTFGDGTTAPCFSCGTRLGSETLTVDRIVPGALGGRYTRDNIRPACHKCNVGAWDRPWRALRDALGELGDEPDPIVDDAVYGAYGAVDAIYRGQEGPARA